MKTKSVVGDTAILKGEREYKIRIKEVLTEDRYLLIDGSVVHKDEIKEIIKNKTVSKK